MEVPGLMPSRYEVPGDVNLGVLVDVSYSGDKTKGEHCLPGTVRMLAVHLCEASIFAARQINALDDLLPNVTLGIICMDTCGNPLSALARSVYLVEDHLPNNCKVLNKPDGHPVQLEHHKVVGVVGPLHGNDAVMVSSYLGIFQIPILGTHTTSDELSDKTRFKYFLGLSPPDKFQVQVMIDMLLRFNWTYIGLFYSEGSYGEYGSKQVQKLVDEHDLCLAFAYRISYKVVKREAGDVLDLLQANPNLKVMIWFTEGDGMKYVFGAIAEKYPETIAIHLFSYFSGYMRVAYPRSTRGSFSIRPVTAYVPGFLDYMNGLIPGNTTENTWMKQRWQQTFECDWTQDSNNSCNNYRADSKWYGYYPIITPYYDGTYVYAHALHNLIEDKCPDSFLKKEKLEECIKGPELLEAMKHVSFEGVLGNISFNENGDRLGRYVITQRVDLPDGQMTTLDVGYWDKLENKLQIREEELDLAFFKTSDDCRLGNMIKTSTGGDVFIPYSVCSWPCAPNEFLIPQKVSCCWECRKCRDNEVVINGTSCEECPLFTWPDTNNPTQCKSITPTYLLWNEPIAISLTGLSSLGTAIVVGTGIVFWNRKHMKLVKASNKELSSILLIGGLMAFTSALMFIIEPADWSCVLRHLGFNLSVNLLYSPLFLKTLTVYRIFYQGKRGLKRPRMVSATAQLALVGLSFLGQAAILFGVNFYSASKSILRMPVSTSQYVELTCTQPLIPFILPLSYNVILILVCAVLGYTSRHLPDNFNESGFIFMSVATTLFAWVVFLPTYFTAAHSHHQMAILSFCLLLNAYITVGCLFGPKLYAIFFVDENTLKLIPMTKTEGSIAPSSSVSSTVQ